MAAGQIEGGGGSGHRLRALRKCRLARRAHEQRSDDELHHAYFVDRSSDPRFLRGNSLRARDPRGAKGIGELPLDGTAPAIANAIANATGADITRIPITPEVLLEMLESVGMPDAACRLAFRAKSTASVDPRSISHGPSARCFARAGRSYRHERRLRRRRVWRLFCRARWRAGE